ncbi:amino acid ABC transporter permease [Caloramator sp. E03]|uniref:amino acid ABC transporter permease n=1 Tax=Caloramator sp. E03 TaxID=2576307 RepID=UPI001110AFB1|nr:amino acid ABC transporter permease [Caloramator sp. E03]QCX32781.1 amino acid ABC transporter permease [Caloramator sp. E03]
MDIKFIIGKLPYLLDGSIMTIKLTVITLFFGSILGVILALLKITKNIFTSGIASFYIWVFRGTPLILQLFFFYYALPMMGITMSPFTAAVIGLSLNCGAYMAEIIRGGIISIDKGQFEAAKALGFNYFQTMKKIVLPQTFRVIIPPVGNEFITMLKDTSLVSTIAMVELMRSAVQISSATFKYTEMLFTAAILYLIMTTVFTSIFSAVEKKLSRYS